MKENRNVNYKARLWVDEKGKLHGISFANRQIPMGLFKALNDAMHDSDEGRYTITNENGYCPDYFNRKKDKEHSLDDFIKLMETSI